MINKDLKIPKILSGVIEFLAKVMSVPFPPARSCPSGFEKNLHSCASLRVVFFTKNLACGEHSLK